MRRTLSSTTQGGCGWCNFRSSLGCHTLSSLNRRGVPEKLTKPLVLLPRDIYRLRGGMSWRSAR